MSSFNLIIIFLLFITRVSQAIEKSDFEMQVSPYIELLGTDWNNKNIDEVSQTQNWESVYSDAGKKKMSFVGNWYRLKIGNWLPQGDWVLIHPLAAQFTFYRNIDGQVHESEHGYKTQSSEKISYRKTAVMLSKIKNDEILYFKVVGMSNRSSHHPKIVSQIKFMSVVSNEAPSVAFYYSLILVVALISLFAFFMLKEKIYFYYSVYLFATIGVFLGIQGYLYQATTHWVPGYSMFFFGMLNFFILLFLLLRACILL